MLQFIITLSDYEQEETSQLMWRGIEKHFKDVDGICYYKHPITQTNEGTSIPDFTVFTRTNQPLIIKCLPYQITDIEDVDEDGWVVNGYKIDSPIEELGTLQRALSRQLRDDRLYNRLKPRSILALPLIAQNAFEKQYGSSLDNACVIWAGNDTTMLQQDLKPMLSEEEWLLLKTISQGIPLHKPEASLSASITTLGAAIRKLDTQIRLLDSEQIEAATKIAPGPQRIRGLAGTGKTVLLAMKAVNLHFRDPNSRILFTFNTRSLYNQVKTLILDFYHTRSDGKDPDWNKLQIRHAWGGSKRAGVYFELCQREHIPFLTYSKKNQFKRCCAEALKAPIRPLYDYIFVDEAQDLPAEFFRILYKLSYAPHQIYWAYDELQSLSSLEIPKPEILFGRDREGNPLVTLEGEDYPGGIEKDYVLHRSYRCPRKVLMLAHALGLGLYSPRGCIQMLGDKASWKSIGYEIESGQFQTGEKVVITRPPANSPNRIAEIYQKQELITTTVFHIREAEFAWVAASISHDIQKEHVAPEQIIVISLNEEKSNEYLRALQVQLKKLGVVSIIPGAPPDSKDEFAKPGYVTLATVHKAKGNEAYVVYVLGFDSLYEYLEEIESRNRAFTSITRSKAWVRITGTGKNMEDAKREVDNILADFPKFEFTFPNMNKIRRLDAENSKRRKEVATGRKSVNQLIELSPEALAALAARDPDAIEEAIKRLSEAKREYQS